MTRIEIQYVAGEEPPTEVTTRRYPVRQGQSPDYYRVEDFKADSDFMDL